MEKLGLLFGLPLLRPMLAVAGRPFNNEEYIFEVKWDGYRCLAYLGDVTQLRSRNLKDLSHVFPELAGLHEDCRETPALVDGEIVVLDNGQPSFNRLQARGRLEDRGRIQAAASSSPALFVAFDLLYAGGQNVMEKPLLERKEILARIFPPARGAVISQYISGQGVEFARACAARGLEGVMAKKIDSPYLPGRRSRYWQKIRHNLEADLVICGYQAGQGSRRLGALVLGCYRDGRLVYAGKVGTGFDRAEEGLLLRRLGELAVAEPVMTLPVPEMRHTRWARPALVCSVKYLALTGEGMLRHPSYLGLREDKSPRECIPPEEQQQS
ncbi:MAG: non-homologous end-joining DNA ligase [Bacillota bacterium]